MKKKKAKTRNPFSYEASHKTKAGVMEKTHRQKSKAARKALKEEFKKYYK